MNITLDLDFYWFAVGSIAVVLAGVWGFRRLKSLLSSR